MPVIASDVSEHQRSALTSAYDLRLLIARVTFGAHYLDQKFLATANEAKRLHAAGEIDGVVLYHVYLASATPAEQFAAIKKAIGPKPPAWLAGIMLDVETWRGQSYAIRGDHSRQLNQLGGMCAAYLGTFNGVLVYGNAGDLAEVAPGRDKRFRVIVANYSSALAYSKVRGAIGQQYTDGQTRWPVPRIGGKALRRSSPPFGACDHNVFPGFATAKALVASMRPTVVKPPAPPRPATPARPAPQRLYAAADSRAANLLTSEDRHAIAYLHGDGRLELRRDSKTLRFL